ncbi:hypothetical protein ERS044112_02630, partial [Streptococcus pneumoniae]
MAEYQPKYSCIRDFFKVSSSSRDFWIANCDLSTWTTKSANSFWRASGGR